MDMGLLKGVLGEPLDAGASNKDRWAQALVKNVTAVTAAFKGAGDQRHAARRTYLSLAPEARTEGYLEVIDEVLYQTSALARLTRNARMAVARRAHVVQFQPGEALCVMGTRQDTLLVVMSGEVAVVEGHVDANTSGPPPGRFGRCSSRQLHPSPQPASSRQRLSELSTSSRSTSFSASSFNAHPTQPSPHSGPPQSSRSAPMPFVMQSGVGPSSGLSSPTCDGSSGGGGGGGSSGGGAALVAPGDALQLDTRHTLHPVLQARSSSVHQRNRVSGAVADGCRTGVVRTRSRRHHGASGGGTDGACVSGGDGAAGGRNGQVVLQRGDSLGAVDMGWLSRVPLSASALAAAAADDPSAQSQVMINSRAMLVTRAENASISGGSFTAQGGRCSGSGSGSGMTQGSSWSGEAEGGGGGGALGSPPQPPAPHLPRTSQAGAGGGTGVGSVRGSSEGDPHASASGQQQQQSQRPDHPQQPQQQQPWKWGRDGSSEDESGRTQPGGGRLGTALGGGGGGGEAEAQLRLKWPCTAVAVGPVECAVIGLQQLCAVLATELWDAEALVDSLEELPVFAALNRDQLLQLVRVLRLNVFSGGTVVYKQGSLGNDLYIIRSGTVRLLKQVALDEGVRHRLNRMSAELSHVRDQSAAAAAALHGGVLGGGGPGGIVGGSGPGTFGTAAGHPTCPLSRSSTPRLGPSLGQGPLGWPGGSQRQGQLGAAAHPRTPRTETPSGPQTPQATPQRPAGPREGTPPAPPSRRSSTAAGRGPSGSGTSTTSSSSVAAAAASIPPLTSCFANRTLPDFVRRSPSQTSSPCDKDTDKNPLTPRQLDGIVVRRHSITAPITSAPSTVPSTPLPASSSQTPTTPGSPGGGGGRRQLQNMWRRRRTSHATADELLDRFGVVPRGFGERTETVYEEVVMPGIVLPGSGGSGAVVSEGSSAAYDGDGGEDMLEFEASGGSAGGGGGSPNRLPPVGSKATPPATPLGSQGSRAFGALSPSLSAAIPLPVWQARAPRPLASGHDLVLVEMGTLTAGQCFGEVRSDGVAVRSSSAVCDTRTEVLTISRNELAHRLGGQVFEYLWSQVPNDGSSCIIDPVVEAGLCAQQLERSMQWTLYKEKLVADLLARKEERRRIAMRGR